LQKTFHGAKGDNAPRKKATTETIAMSRFSTPAGWLLSGVIAFTTGCGSSEKPDNGPAKPGKTTTAAANGEDTKKPSANGASKTEKPPDIPEAPPARIYPVELSEDHAKTCLVKSGDKLPDFTLKDLQGAPHTSSSLLDQKLLVVLFWNGESSQSKNALVYLREDAVKNAKSGVKYVAINVGEPADAAKEAVEKAKAKYPVLLDTDKALFGKVATDLLPRVYLLDHEGRIVWFNVTFQGPDTRNKLNAAIEYVLTADKKKGG
jgi:peroxiredoxin